MSLSQTIDLTREGQWVDVPVGTLLLNGFPIHFSAQEFSAYVKEKAGGEKKQYEEELGDEWMLYARRGDLYGLPRVSEPQNTFGTKRKLRTDWNLGLLAQRLEELISDKMSGKTSVEGHPLSFLGTENLLEKALDQFAPVPEVAYGYSIKLRFNFTTEIVQPDEGQPRLCVFLRVKTKYHVGADLQDLLDANVDLNGLFVVRKTPAEGEPRVAGRIRSIEGNVVHLVDAPDETTTISIDDVNLEARSEAFYHCLRYLTGSKRQKILDQVDVLIGQHLNGYALLETLKTTARHFRQRIRSIQILPGLYAEFGNLIRVRNTPEHTSVVFSGPVEHCFDPARTQRDTYSWRGLVKFGPFSRSSFSRREPHLLVVCPDTAKGQVEQFVKGLLDGVGDGRLFAGFGSTFRLTNPRFSFCLVPWMGANGTAPGPLYRSTISEHLRELLAKGGPDYDAAIVAVLDEHANLPHRMNPYLSAKATLLMNGIPVQQARMDTIRKRNPYSYQNIATALYAKMGGTPWTVDQDQTVADELVIGLGVAEQGARFGPSRRLVGITTVFRGDGNYLLGYLARQCPYEEYPSELKRTTMEVLRKRKNQESWLPGETVRIVFHSYKPLKGIEIDQIVAECVAEVGKDQNIEFAFLTISREHPYALLDVNQHGIAPRRRPDAVKGRFFPERGTIVQVGRYHRLVSTLGPGQSLLPDMPLHRPLLLKLHRPQDDKDFKFYKDLTYLSEQVLRFTGLSWRTVRPVKLPVTIRYSKHIAEQLGELGELDFWSPETLNTKLASSLWFL